MLLNCGVGEGSWESLGLKGDSTSPSKRKSVLNIHWKVWCCSWNSNTVATWWEELTHWKRTLMLGKIEGRRRRKQNRGWDGWMASPTQWTWVWVNSRSWWWTGRPGVLQSMGPQRIGYDWVTERNWSHREYVPEQIFWPDFCYYFRLQCLGLSLPFFLSTGIKFLIIWFVHFYFIYLKA